MCLFAGACTAQFGPMIGSKPGNSNPCIPGQPGACALLTLGTVGRLGANDPSIADTPQGATAYMSYSGVTPSPTWRSANPLTIATHIGQSANGGTTWTVGCSGTPINPRLDVTIAGGPATWNSEVPSLVYDASADSAHKWKLFWHHYLYQNGQGLQNNAWIGYKAADAPCDLAAATEVKLFAGAGYNSANNTAGGTTGSPVGGAPVLQLNRLNTSLNSCQAFTEPGGLAQADGTLFLSLSCQMGGTNNSIFVIKCAAPCDPTNAADWTFAGTSLTTTDATAVGLVTYNAPDIFAVGSTYYMLITPVVTDPKFGARYNGCNLFKFSNLSTGSLLRGGTGSLPVLLSSLNGIAGQNNGGCTYTQNVRNAGIDFGQFMFSVHTFYIIQTNVDINT